MEGRELRGLRHVQPRTRYPHSEPMRPLIVLASLVLVSACTGTSPTPSVTPVTEDPWSATAGQYRGQDGQQFDYDCPAGGTADTVWGTDVYTDDSSVCTAAVHAGVITLGDGGMVTIEIRPSEDSYDASEANGISAQSYGGWGGSFVIVPPAG